LGRQEGRNLEIVNSVEVKFTMTQGTTDIAIDENFMRERIEAYKKMYTDLDCIGWYSCTQGQGAAGDKPFEQDMQVHKREISNFCENPLFLLMNPES